MAYGVATGAGISGVTEADVFIPEIWSSAVSGYLERALRFKGMVEDYSALVSGGSDTIHVPSISEVTVQDKAENTAVEYDATVETKVSLAINKHKYASKMFEQDALRKAQDSGLLLSAYASNMGYALAKQLDQDIATELTGNLSSGATLATDDTITDAELEAMLASLGEADMDYRDGQLSMVVNPTVYADLLNNPKFVRYDSLGKSNVPSGRLGEIFGIGIEMSNALASSGTAVSGIVFHKSACAFAMQQQIQAQSQFDIDFLSVKTVFDCAYGVKMIHASRGYKFTNAT